MKRLIVVAAMAVYIMAVIISSAGAFTAAHLGRGVIFVVGGVLNLLCGFYAFWRTYKDKLEHL